MAEVVLLRRERGPGEVEISVLADLNEQTVAEFRAALYAELDTPHTRIALDLAKVRTINSASLGAILLFQKKAREKGKMVVISACSDELRQTLLMIRFDRSVQLEGEDLPGPSREALDAEGNPVGAPQAPPRGR